MTVIDLKKSSNIRWKQTIFSQYPFLPCWWIKNVSHESRQALMSQETDRTLADEKSCLAGYMSDKGDLLGFVQTRYLEWDTNHFGFEIWRLDHMGVWDDDSSQQQKIANALLGKIIQTAYDQGCKAIHARIPVDNISSVHAMESNGFRTMESLSTWIFDFAKSPIPPKKNPDMIRDFKPDDMKSLVEMARTVYAPIPSRFNLDTELPDKECNDLYAEWIQNSCSGQMADLIAVAEARGEPVGYATMKYFGDYGGLCNARIAELGLGAVRPGFRNRGLITDLIIHNLEWLKKRHADFCFVNTQGNNIPPQKAFLRTGFNPALVMLTLHCVLTSQP